MHRREPCSKSIVVRSPCTKDLGAFTLSLPAIRSDSYLSCEPYRPPQPLPLSSGWRIAASNGEDTARRTSSLVQVTFATGTNTHTIQKVTKTPALYTQSTVAAGTTDDDLHHHYTSRHTVYRCVYIESFII
jgi:hypothetical protein